jgi:hypothetical protein
MRQLPRGMSLPYFHSRLRATRNCGFERKAPRAAGTIINGMKPLTIGRALGIGVRVASRIVGQRLAAQGQSAADANQTQAVELDASSAVQNRVSGQAAGQFATQAGRGVSRGIGGLLRPFGRVGGILWLEVTGAFFLLFAAVFILRLWQNWAGLRWFWRNLEIGAAAVFLYLGVSAFWRARRR